MTDLPIEQQNLNQILDAYPSVASDLLDRVRTGRINGNNYHVTNQLNCGCIFGWTCHLVGPHAPEETSLGDELGLEGKEYRTLDDGCFDYYPIEWYVMPVRPGQTPEDTPVLANIERWIVDWLAAHA